MAFCHSKKLERCKKDRDFWCEGPKRTVVATIGRGLGWPDLGTEVGLARNPFEKEVLARLGRDAPSCLQVVNQFCQCCQCQ